MTEIIPPLNAKEVTKLANAGYSNVYDLLEASDAELMGILGCDVQKVRKARLAWGQKVLPKSILASEYRCNRVVTGLNGLDNALGGGMRTGTLIEFVGRAGCGKTQICMQLAASTAAVRGGNAVYLDTEGAFRPRRLAQIARARGWITNETQSEDMLSRIHVMRPSSADDLLERLSDGEAIESRAGEAKAELLILDSIAALARADFAGRVVDRQAWLATAAASLKRIASRHKLVAVVTNHVIADFSRGGCSGLSFYGRGADPVSPALGLLWSHCVTTRCFLEKRQVDPPFIDTSLLHEDTLNYGSMKHTEKPPLGCLMIIKAPDVPNSTIKYRIDAAGLLDDDHSSSAVLSPLKTCFKLMLYFTRNFIFKYLSMFIELQDQSCRVFIYFEVGG